MKTVVVIYIALIVLAMSACGTNKQDNNQATVPAMGTDCVNNTACQTNLYQTNTGFYAYNQNYYAGNGGLSSLCSCPYGSLPTYNNYAGLGCVQSSQLYNGGYAYGSNLYAYAYFTWGSNSQWTNIPQISNLDAGYTSSSCFNGVVQSCLIGQANTCSAGYMCRPSAASSRLGLCVSTMTTNTNGGNSFR